MQRGSRSWTRDDDVKLIEAAIFAKRRSRVAARVDLGKNGPKFYYDNASEQLKHLPSDWKQRFNHLLDLYRGERMTVQLSKMLAAAKDGRLYRDKSSTEAVDRSESNESDAEEPVFEAEEVIPQHNKREKAKADTVDNDPDLSDLELSTEAAIVALNGKRNGVHPNKRVKEEPLFSRKDRLLARDRATDRAKRARESADSGPDEKPAVGEVGHLDTEHERDMMRHFAEELATFGDHVVEKKAGTGQRAI